MKLFYLATQPLWTWYTAQITECLTPADNISYVIADANGRWGRHLRDMIELVLFDATEHQNVGIAEAPAFAGAVADCADQDSLCDRLFMIEWHLLYRRAWSQLVHDVPPNCYAGYCSPRAALQTEASNLMRSDWGHLGRLEAMTNPAARFLRGDLSPIADSEPLRLLSMFYERDRFSPASRSGDTHLRGLIAKPPDNKLVEDMQKDVRNEARFNMTKKLTNDHIQDVVNRSKVFASRKIPYRTPITKEEFLRDFGGLGKTKTAGRRKFYAIAHKLPAEWTRIMAKRSWASHAAEGSLRPMAGWVWMREYFTMLDHFIAHGPGAPLPRPDGAFRSVLVPPFCVIGRGDEARARKTTPQIARRAAVAELQRRGQ